MMVCLELSIETRMHVLIFFQNIETEEIELDDAFLKMWSIYQSKEKSVLNICTKNNIYRK